MADLIIVNKYSSMGRKMKTVIVLLMLIFSAQLSYAQNTGDLFSKVLDQLHLSKDSIFNYDDIKYDIYFRDVFPYIKEYSKDKCIVAFAKEAGEGEDGLEYDAYILLIEKNTGKILNEYYKPKAWGSDAIRLSDIAIDTTLYKLNNKIKAFGILVHYLGSSHPNPMTNTDLSLFIPEGKSLKRILQGYPVYDHHGEFGYEDCSSNYDQSDTCTITSNQRQSDHGFYNLVIKEKIVTRTGMKKGCVVKRAVQHKVTTLKYNGNEYPFEIDWESL